MQAFECSHDGQDEHGQKDSAIYTPWSESMLSCRPEAFECSHDGQDEHGQKDSAIYIPWSESMLSCGP